MEQNIKAWVSEDRDLWPASLTPNPKCFSFKIWGHHAYNSKDHAKACISGKCPFVGDLPEPPKAHWALHWLPSQAWMFPTLPWELGSSWSPPVLRLHKVMILDEGPCIVTQFVYALVLWGSQASTLTSWSIDWSLSWSLPSPRLQGRMNYLSQ